VKRPHTHEMITISPIMESDVEVIEDMAWKAFNSITTIHSILESKVSYGLTLARERTKPTFLCVQKYYSVGICEMGLKIPHFINR